MSKHSEQFKLEVVEQYLSGEAGFKALGKRHELGYSMIRRWVERYREHGGSGLRKKFSHYSAEFKLSVLQRMWSEQLSYTQTAALYDIRGDRSIPNWERQYHGGGIDALKPRQRGRPRKMPTRAEPPEPPAPDGADPRPREELLKEIENLRAEVAYLKKLDAVIQAGKRQTQPKKHK